MLFGAHARLREDDNIRQLLEHEWTIHFQEDRDKLRNHAKENIAKIQEENRRVYNKTRKKARLYREDDLVAIRRMQQAPGLKLASRYLGPYRIVKVLRNNHYLVHKVGENEEPRQTSTAADFMKLWLDEDSDVEFDEGADEGSDEENKKEEEKY